MKKKLILIGLLSVVLVVGLVLVGCGGSDEPDNPVVPVMPKLGAAPIKYHPASRQITLTDWEALDDADKALSVTMAAAGTYTYQWYKTTSLATKDNKGANTAGAERLEGKTAVTFVPEIDATGNYYYYVTVAGDGKTFTSNPAIIKVVDAAITPASYQFSIGVDRLNYVRGIGGTGSFMFRQGSNADASPDADVNYIDLLFGVLGCNILRIMVQDDYENYINNAVQSRNSDVFYHNARDNFFPVIQRANAYGGYVFANPWTAPASMKTSGLINGGVLKDNKQDYVRYANHLRGFLQWLNANNAPIFAIGILNEPDYGATANYEGMGFTSSQIREWFLTVGHYTTQQETRPRDGEIADGNSTFATSIIPGYGGGGPTHHVLAMSVDNMGTVRNYYNESLGLVPWGSGLENSSGPAPGSNITNNRIELIGRHYYNSAYRYTEVAGALGSFWRNRPQLDYVGPYEAASLAQSKQMYAPGSQPGDIKREVWQTEHDFNYHENSTTPPPSNVQNYWNSAFAAVNDVDWSLRVAGESVFDWWYSSSYSGLVTSYQPAGFPPYTITPRGRAFAHYARYVNETWLLPITKTAGASDFNNGNGTTDFNAGSTVPKISAFEDVNGKFINIVMFTPSTSTNNGAISSGFGAGGTDGNDDPTRGSVNVGRIAVALPAGFTASSASAIRSYGNANADGKSWDDVPTSSPRYWIDEPVFLSEDDESGKSVVEVTLPGGNLISIMVRGEWASTVTIRHFEERVRPYTVW